ncbi:MAG: UxaA family hydrolase [Pseudomonadota bacterium]
MTGHVMLNPADTVATVLADMEAGQTVSVTVDGKATILTLSGPIAYAHKIAVRAMAPGDPVIKYGEVIGLASQAIQPGDWVHVHNVDSARARGDQT